MMINNYTGYWRLTANDIPKERLGSDENPESDNVLFILKDNVHPILGYFLNEKFWPIDSNIDAIGYEKDEVEYWTPVPKKSKLTVNEMSPFQITLWTDGLIGFHNMPCPIYPNEKAIYIINKGIFGPSWKAQSKGYYLVKIPKFIYRILDWLNYVL